MTRSIPYYIVFFFLLSSVLSIASSCDDSGLLGFGDEKFTQDPSRTLTFSTDTLRFDTIISTVGSTTKLVKVFNFNEDGIRIVSVRLAEGKKSMFRVNVDGEYLPRSAGSIAYDFEVRGGDSLYVRAEVTVDERNQNEVFDVSDTLIFYLESGREQKLTLTAKGMDAYHWREKVVDQDTTLTAGRPFVVYDSLVVAEGATLTMLPGVKLFFHDKAELRVHGTLKALGTLGNEVVFRGDRTDRMFDYLPYDNTPSRWGGIRLFSTSLNNEFYHTDIHSAQFGIVCDRSELDEMKLTLENSVLHNIGGHGLKLEHCRALVANTQISNVLGDCVYQIGGWSEFVHCTFAQFYPWEANRGMALYLTNHLADEPYPLYHAHFVNCLMSGYPDDVIQGDLDEVEGEHLDYFFGYSYLNTVETDDAERFVGIVYDNGEQALPKEKNFVRFDTYNFLYDFRLKESSGARNIGDVEVAARYPFDRYGMARTLDEGPDAGCYEFVVKEEE